VAAATEENAVDVINQMNLKYQGNADFSMPEGQVRVTYKIRPENVWGHG
jgi:hypothetical protein